MNLFKSLLKGVQGVLQGKVLKVETKRSKKKEGEEKEYVIATVGIPDLFINFDLFIPEQFIPDCLEGRSIQLLPNIKVGSWNKPELDLSIAGFEDEGEFD